MAERRAKDGAGVAAPRRILVVDDHPVVRDGLAAQVATEPDLVVVGATGDPAEALALIVARQPDVVIVDITLERRSGLDLIRQIRANEHDMPILVWSMHPEKLYAERAIKAGAQGYIEKIRGGDDVVAAIRTVLAGRIYASVAVMERVLQRFGAGGGQRSGIDALSDRELQAFELMGAGLSTVDIAARMSVSPKTVETYRVRIKEKLGLMSFAEVIQHATAWMLERR